MGNKFTMELLYQLSYIGNMDRVYYFFELFKYLGIPHKRIGIALPQYIKKLLLKRSVFNLRGS